jgi:hypothetical protein
MYFKNHGITNVGKFDQKVTIFFKSNVLVYFSAPQIAVPLYLRKKSPFSNKIYILILALAPVILSVFDVGQI